jgi:hypothetical protein
MAEVGKVRDARGYDRRIDFNQKTGEVSEVWDGIIFTNHTSLGVKVKTPGEALATAKALLNKKTG